MLDTTRRQESASTVPERQPDAYRRRVKAWSASVMEEVLPAFLERGYVVLEDAFTPAELAMLRAQACCLTQRLAAAGRDLCDEQCVAEVIEHLNHNPHPSPNPDPDPDLNPNPNQVIEHLPEGHAARTEAADYLRLREAELPSTDPALMRSLLMRKLAAVASAALSLGAEGGGGEGGGGNGDGGEGSGGEGGGGEREFPYAF